MMAAPSDSEVSLSDDELELLQRVVFGKALGPVEPFVFGVTDVTGPVANQMLVKPLSELFKADQSSVMVSFLYFGPCLLN